MMTRDEFQLGLERWGGRLENWPAEARAQALKLMDGQADMATALADAARLESLLDRVDAPDPSTALLGRIMAQAHAAPQGIAGWFRSVWAQGAALVAAAALGLMVGLVEASEVRGAGDLFLAQDEAQSSSLESLFGEGGE